MNSLMELREVAKELEEICRDSFVDIQNLYKKVSARTPEFSIHFLGTGQGAHHIASKGKQQIREYRLVSGPIISTPQTAIWIDPGPDCLQAINHADIDPRHVDAIFITHAHADHVGNLICATELISGATEIKGEKSLYGNLTTILGGPDNPGSIDVYHSKVILKEVKPLEVGDEIKIKDLHVLAIPCYHKETPNSENSLNYRITIFHDKTKMVISHIDGNILIPNSDGEPSEDAYTDIIEACKGSSILIVNVADHVRMRTSRQNYPSTKGLIKLLKEIKPKMAFTTHFGIEMINLNSIGHRILERYGFRNLIDFQESYAQMELQADNIVCNVVAAKDFLKVLIENDTVTISLKGFIIKTFDISE